MTTGVIIGRFQVPELTIGHKALIVQAYRHFDKIAFLLGESPEVNVDNPLPFACRKHMLAEWDPAFVGKVADTPGNDWLWSTAVDKAIEGMAMLFELGSVTLVGGRKSFIPSYRGGYPTLEIPVWVGRSGTEVRRQVLLDGPGTSADFRRGVIWSVGMGLKW